MLWEYVSFSLKTFTRRPTRSWLTILGIFIGIAAVVSLTSIGQGLQDAVMRQFQAFGTNTLFIYPGTGEFALFGTMGGTQVLHDRDVRLVEDVGGVDRVAGFFTSIATIEHMDEKKSTFVIGMSEGWTISEFSSGIGVFEGRELQQGDSKQVVVGYLLATGDFFKNPVRMGHRLYIEGEPFRVVGSLDKIGNRADDSQIYIPLKTAQTLFDKEGYNLIYVKIKPESDPDIVATQITEKIRKDRNQKEGEEDFSVQTMGQLSKTVDDVIGVIKLAVIGIATISIVVGGVGIMNTMYTSVLERTHEIGIMKAIGARDRDIALLFVIESGALGLVGGALGVAAGMAVGYGVESVAQSAGFALLKVSPAPWLIGGSLLFSFIIGVASGLMPAMNAAKMRPVEALRYE